MSRYRLHTSAPCYPVTLVEARRHLAVDASDRSNDALIDMLIASATADAESKTGRVWVESEWEWIPDSVGLGEPIEFPLVPVTKVAIYDLDEAVEDGQPRTDISGDVVDVIYPSPEPQGSPLIGSLLPIAAFPERHQIILTVGYPVEKKEKDVEQFDSPVLVLERTSYADGVIRLVFNRPVTGKAVKENFVLEQDGRNIALEGVGYRDGSVELIVAAGELREGSPVKVTFYEGEIYDVFYNFVQPFPGVELPTVAFVSQEDFMAPDPVPVEYEYASLAPAPVKNWILTRVGSLYSQRTEIALRAGKSNDAMFPDEFINNLLNPYKVRFVKCL